MIKQLKENIPAELLTKKQWVAVGDSKRSFTGWNKAKNWQEWDTIQIQGKISGRGFVISSTNFLVIDGDHVLNDKGEYVNERVQAFFDQLKTFPATYMERSCSGQGVHIIYNVPGGLSVSKLSGGEKATLYLDEYDNDKSAKIELWYHTMRQFVLTGDLWQDAPKTIANGDSFAPGFINELLERIKADREAHKEDSETATNAPVQPPTTPDGMTSHSEADVARELLNFIPADCQHDDWVRVGMALKDSDCIFADFLAWSATGGDKFKGERECQTVWNSFKGTGVKLGTLVNLAKEYGDETAVKKVVREWHKANDNDAPIVILDESANSSNWCVPGGDGPDEIPDEIRLQELEEETARRNKAADMTAELEKQEKKAKAHISKRESLALSWPKWDYFRKEPIPLATAPENTEYLLQYMHVSCRYNLLTKELELTGLFLSGVRTNDDKATKLLGVANEHGLKITRNGIEKNLALIGGMNQYSPVRDFLNDCYKQYTDTGKNPIHDVFSCFTLNKAERQDPALCETFFRKWLIGCARMAFNKGLDSMEGLIVLKGPQGIGKSRGLQMLSPVAEWTTKGMSIDPANKDDVLKAASYWIVELGEIGSTLKKDMDRLKAYINGSVDTVRKPYGKDTEKIARVTAFYGSTNEDRFLKDYTGNRRFWVISVIAIDLEKLAKIDLVKLWGYIMHLWRDENEKHYFEDQELKKVIAYIDSHYRNITDEEQLLLDSLNWNAPVETWKEYTTKEVSQVIGLQGKRLHLIGRVLKVMADSDNRIGIKGDNKHGRKYKLPPEIISDKVIAW